MLKLSITGMLALLCSLNTLAAAAGFPLIENDKGARVWYDGGNTVIESAIRMLIEDSEMVAEQPFSTTSQIDDRTIIVGIFNNEPRFDSLLRRYNVQITGLDGTWEGFTIRQGEHNGRRLLFVAGSDPRGAAYGVMELSRAIGVSPWIWWADVLPRQVENLEYMSDGSIHSPSVQYRGIFINDEDWGLMPWSTKTFEPTETPGAIGPATYGKVCELLLRLRANTLWPAMHECTVPFYFVPGNLEIAHKYGIIVGTSHCEPLMRTNTGEWDDKKYGAYNFITNRENVTSYWSERLDEVSHTENIYTMGMRGVHDGRMQGVSTLDDETAVLQEVIATQRELLARHNNSDIETIPQVFIPYKEVLNAYDNGLELPDDVTLVWCDDNHGHITRLSNEQEQKRSGGSGVYYHVSYWGKPHDYLWLASTQPALIYTEMKRAWDHGAQRIWILNAGDIKPAEYLTEFFLDLAWNIDSVNDNTIYDHQLQWYKTIFGPQTGKRIHEIMKGYYHLAAHRKPEHMGWSRVEDRTFPRGLSPVTDTRFSPFYYNDEVYRREQEYFDLYCQSYDIYNSLPEALTHSYFQLVMYPVASSWTINHKLLSAQLSRLYEHTSPLVSRQYAQSAQAAYNDILTFEEHYNKNFSSGKWDRMMDSNPRNLPVFGPPEVPASYAEGNQEILVWVDNETTPIEGDIRLAFTEGAQEKHIIKVHTTGLAQNASVTLHGTSRLKVEMLQSVVPDELRLEVSLKEPMSGDYIISDQPCLFELGETSFKIEYHILPVPTGADPKYSERNGMIALDAADHTNDLSTSTIEGLGHSSRAVRLPAGADNYLEYDIYTFDSGPAILKVGMIPIHSATNNVLRYAVQLDGGPIVEKNIHAKFLSPEWSENVLRNQSLTQVELNIDEPGHHKIRIYALDEELFVDQLMLDFRPERQHYLIPSDLSLQFTVAGQK